MLTKFSEMRGYAEHLSHRTHILKDDESFEVFSFGVHQD